MYFVKTPKLLKSFFKYDIEERRNFDENVIYLTFDDGPFEGTTDFILNILDKYSIKATFFVLGKQIENLPNLFTAIEKGNHLTGNHTFTHLRGWDKSNFSYYKEIIKTEKYLKHKIFRPPYGQIRQQQFKTLKKHGYKVFLWDVLPGDFDRKITNETCLKNAINNTIGTSNIVFHENEKSKEKLKFCLEPYIKTMLDKGYTFDLMI